MAEPKTFADSAQMIADMSKRLQRLAPVLKVIAEEISEQTDRSFAESKSRLGVPFAPLATSTIIERMRKRSPAARKRQKNAPHLLTKGAKAKRLGAVMAYHNALNGVGSAGITTLIDTARMRRSQRTLVKNNALEWSAVGYMAPHMTGAKVGSSHMPKRNPTVFERYGGQWKMIPKMHTYVVDRVSKYVRTGEVVA